MESKELTKILKDHKLWLSDNTKGSRANLYGANLAGASLTRANLAEANLTRANLTGANLTGANLTGAYLTWANLTGANLYGANLTRANLTGANLTRANLTGVNLTGANLTGANLTGADLTEANLTRADLTRANYSPSLILHQVNWESVSTKLCKLLMAIDAQNHPNPKAFDSWKNNGDCPYSNTNELRVVSFHENRHLWSSNLINIKLPSSRKILHMLFKEKNIKY